MNNIVISGYYGSKNAGDEAMLSAMLEVFWSLIHHSILQLFHQTRNIQKNVIMLMQLIG